MRGKRFASKPGLNWERIIPARAGQTCRCGLRRTRLPDHPRACGANPTGLYLEHFGSGSSPRVRGKLIRHDDFPAFRRIIPARAGQTPAFLTIGPSPPDHPRACGANPLCLAGVGLSGGSSPRVRGKRDGFFGGCARERIIPARAGQTRARQNRMRAH